MRCTDGAGGCYTIPMGLCYVPGFKALTLALVVRLPGDYYPLEGSGVIDQQESVAGLSGHSLLAASLFIRPSVPVRFLLGKEGRFSNRQAAAGGQPRIQRFPSGD